MVLLFNSRCYCLYINLGFLNNNEEFHLKTDGVERHAFAIVAQSVERWLPKPKVAESCSVYRSKEVWLSGLKHLTANEASG